MIARASTGCQHVCRIPMAWASPVPNRRGTPRGLVGTQSQHIQGAPPSLAFQLVRWNSPPICYAAFSQPRFSKAQQGPFWPHSVAIFVCSTYLDCKGKFMGVLPSLLLPVSSTNCIPSWGYTEYSTPFNLWMETRGKLPEKAFCGRENCMSSFLAWKGLDG